MKPMGYHDNVPRYIQLEDVVFYPRLNHRYVF
jgi:hypothetical protein